MLSRALLSVSEPRRWRIGPPQILVRGLPYKSRGHYGDKQPCKRRIHCTANPCHPTAPVSAHAESKRFLRLLAQTLKPGAYLRLYGV